MHVPATAPGAIITFRHELTASGAGYVVASPVWSVRLPLRIARLAWGALVRNGFRPQSLHRLLRAARDQMRGFISGSLANVVSNTEP